MTHSPRFPPLCLFNDTDCSTGFPTISDPFVYLRQPISRFKHLKKVIRNSILYGVYSKHC